MRYREDRRLSVQEAQALTTDQLRWYRALGYLMPIGGAEEPPDGAGEGDGAEGEGDVALLDGTGDSGEGDGEGEGEGASEGDEGDGDGSGHPEDLMELKRSEYERLRRIAREKSEADKRREKDERAAREKQRRAEGQYEELLKEKDEQIRNVEGERDEARYQLDNYKRQIRVTEAAKRLGFKDPGDAFRFLSEEDTEDETSTERALRRLARAKDYLVSERRATGAPVAGDGVALTHDQLKNMSDEEINSRWDEVQKSLASG